MIIHDALAPGARGHGLGSDLSDHCPPFCAGALQPAMAWCMRVQTVSLMVIRIPDSDAQHPVAHAVVWQSVWTAPAL